MLGDSLTRDAGARGQLADGSRSFLVKSTHKAQAGRVSERRKKRAEWSSPIGTLGLGGRRKVFLDELDDHAPALLVGREGLGAARERDLIKAGFLYGEQDAARDFLQSEFDERGGLFRIIDDRLDGVVMPAKGEKTFGFDALDGDFERHALLLLLKFGDFRVHGSSDNFSGDARARFERSVE